MQFNSLQEFWAALDRLDEDFRRLKRSQDKLAEKLAREAQLHVEAPNRIAASNQRLDATIAVLSLRIAKLAATVRRNEKRLKRSHRRI